MGSQILSGTMSLQERWSTLMPFSQGCTLLSQIIRQLKTLVISSYIAVLTNLPKLSKVMGIGSLCGELLSKRHNLFSHIARPKWRSTMIILCPTLPLSIRAHIERSSNLNKAIRKHVRSVNNVLLNEFGKFHYLETQHLHGHGAGKSSTHAKERANQKESTSPSVSWRKSDPYHLWNKGKCKHQASTCKFCHVCECCRGPHCKTSCPGKQSADT